MALPLPPGLTPPEVAFLCEMELVTVVPRQRLEGLELLGGTTPELRPPYRAVLPLWLALLLKRQRRANILPPPWLHPSSLDTILRLETEVHKETFSPPPLFPPSNNNLHETRSAPFLPSCTADAAADALPYHWLEVGEILLDAAPDDLVEPDTVRRLMRDLREVRMAKMRAGVAVLDGGAVVGLKGVGGMEVSEGRAFISGVIDNLRKIGASREQSRREREAEERENGYDDADEDEDMGL
ncbi:GINS complex, PSF2 component [Xylona heveae TC161]|uniref:DNA replication complex GINS protein PSF2 n=1 Tax=Xylona heveae (strain CBS 132557 / TC161) TaxID=1328760 RepID=A0A165ISR0_XYLHT|nr:GINS complex, PSF2 component [Xylona heveae TC161]KZF25331.1 GINS complex, PSF2 component [Xylona heveae TC161]